jgi:hypothetical protein
LPPALDDDFAAGPLLVVALRPARGEAATFASALDDLFGPRSIVIRSVDAVSVATTLILFMSPSATPFHPGAAHLPLQHAPKSGVRWSQSHHKLSVRMFKQHYIDRSTNALARLLAAAKMRA